jgi:hypothetical protein
VNEGIASSPEERRALFRVVRGTPSDEELAALTVVLAAAASVEEPARSAPRNLWSDPATRLRTPLPVGEGAWRTTYWPR